MKPLEEYHRAPKSKDGRDTRCRACYSELWALRKARNGSGKAPQYKTLDEIMDAIDITTLLARDMERFREVQA